jgi:hypothetical protein
VGASGWSDGALPAEAAVVPVGWSSGWPEGIITDVPASWLAVDCIGWLEGWPRETSALLGEGMATLGAFVLLITTGVLLAGAADVVAAVSKYIPFVVLVTADEVVKNETRTWSSGAPAAETGEQLTM